MRQGPAYSQRIELDERGLLQVSVPLELTEALSKKDVAIWHDNGDDSYTITTVKIRT
jgi:hypothetical protein